MNQTQSNEATGSQGPRRRANRRIITPLLLAIIFISGGLVGAGLTVVHRSQQRPRARRSTEQIRDRLTQRIAQRLDLSEQQTAHAREVIEQRLVELKELRRQVQPQMEAQAAILHSRLEALLDERQKALWDELYAELFARWFADPVTTQPSTAPVPSPRYVPRD